MKLKFREESTPCRETREGCKSVQIILIGLILVSIVNIFQNGAYHLSRTNFSIAIVTRSNTSTAGAMNSSIEIESTYSYSVDPYHDQANKPLCLRQQIHPGKWLPIQYDLPPYISSTVHLRCQLPDYDYDSPGPWPSYFWQPDDGSCSINAWNASMFCSLVPFATVSIIGDSLSWEQYSALLQLLGNRVHQTDQHKSLHENRNVVYFSCREANRGTKFVFRNDPQLKADTVLDSISHDFPTILILNRGAHYVDDKELLIDIQELLPALLSWQKVCTESYSKCHLFWRTTVPGHTRCEEYTVPVNDLTTMESLVESHDNYSNETIWNFHWQDFKRQNHIIQKEFNEFASSSGLQYEVIDAYEINILRPDRHRWHQNDCLHNCYPGKMDLYNQLLLHYLMMQRSKHDVRYMIDRFEQVRSSNGE